MSVLAQVSLYAFIACWAVSVIAWLHGSYFFMRWWLAQVTGRAAPLSMLKKTLPGLVAGLGAFALALVCAAVGEFWGGGWR